MTIILFDGPSRGNLLPLTFTRPVGHLRIGILTIGEKWEKWLKSDSSYLTQPYLQKKFPAHFSELNYLINGSVCPDEGLCEAIDKLVEGEALFYQDVLIALKLNQASSREFDPENVASYRRVDYTAAFVQINYPEDIFSNNDQELHKDFALLTKGRVSAPISSTNTLLGNDIFLEDGAQAECSTLNSLQGPIYIGKNSQIWEGCHIRGSFAICNDSQVKMGARIYGMTTVGPFCRVGGEINNSVIWG
ncbi:MAG TPA: putative sugar nucleotidyl transferase, partial [Daejeonella sp.]|nr:putative sugar nucleotidyl transferase [Daejeonella sp.]